MAGSAWRALVGVFLLAGLAGCTLQREALAPRAGDSGRIATLVGLDPWSARGRIAVRTDRVAGQMNDQTGGQAELDWLQRGAETRLRVNGPLGAGAVELRWTPQRLTVSRGNGEERREFAGPDDADRFLVEQFGFRFPVQSARYWLLGVPDPATAAELRAGPDDRVQGFVQYGWSVSYVRFARVAGLLLPVRLVLERPGTRLKLVIDRWRIGNAALD